jgi:Cu-processing system ATP-binding protein
MSHNPPLVSLQHVSKQYKDFTALNDVCLSLQAGEVIGLLGHNGAGKTTLMKLILGVISPSHGNVNVMGIAPDNKAAWHIRQKVGYLPENVSFYDHLTGLEVLTYFAKLKGFSKKEALVLLEQVGLTYAMKRAVKTYSKGMRQRLGLAQAFLGNPKLLLLDEPTVGLDPIATSEFYSTVDQLKSNGASIILCSHVLPGIEKHIDRAMILGTGKVLATGTLAQLREQANLPATIIPSGINGYAAQDKHLSQFLREDKHTLFVPEMEKMTVLKQLLALENLQNINVESASLDKLYQYYLAQNSSSSSNQQAQ